MHMEIVSDLVHEIFYPVETFLSIWLVVNDFPAVLLAVPLKHLVLNLSLY